MIKKPREIWKIGVPLNEAWLRWSKSDIRKIYHDNSVPDIFGEHSQNTEDSIGLRAIQIIGSLATALDKPRRNENLKSTMRDELVAFLKREQLVAFGNPVLPKEDRTPRRISSEFWINAKINWEEEIARDESYKFQKIRVIDPKDFPNTEVKPKIGRKSHKDLIIAAIKELEKTTFDFEDYTNKNKINCIWDYLTTHNPELNRDSRGLKDDTLRKIISSYSKNKN